MQKKKRNKEGAKGGEVIQRRGTKKGRKQPKKEKRKKLVVQRGF
jgi:hypothetical protein